MLSSMQGSLGIGANIANWTPEETALAKRLIAAYHQVQPTIVQGDLYRLISPRNGSEFSATQTVNADKSQSVVFAFIHSTQEGRVFPRLKLKGLDPAAEYALSSIEGKAAAGTPAAASGAWWMNHGWRWTTASAEIIRPRRSAWTGSKANGAMSLRNLGRFKENDKRDGRVHCGHPQGAVVSLASVHALRHLFTYNWRFSGLGLFHHESFTCFELSASFHHLS